MVTALAGGLALFALGVAGVLAVLGASRASFLVTSLAGLLAIVFVTFAITGDRRERRCVARVPALGTLNLPDEINQHQRKLEKCWAGRALGFSEPF